MRLPATLMGLHGCALPDPAPPAARAAYERLLRKLQALPHRPAVVAVQTYSFIRGSAGTFHKVGGGVVAGWLKES